MRFSIICPSYLGYYPNAAKDRERKITRMIDSVMAQSFQDFELIIVSDGCDKTVEICEPYVNEYYPQIKLFKIPKQKIWSGSVRNAGISKAQGDIIIYIDIDDILGENHLKIINENFDTCDWAYSDHLIWSAHQENFIPYRTNIDVHGQCGTSSIAHRRSLNAYWLNNSYSHDFDFINTLKSLSKNYKKMQPTQYKVCHTPNGIDY